MGRKKSKPKSKEFARRSRAARKGWKTRRRLADRMGRKKSKPKSKEFARRSRAARKGWKTRRRLADGGYRLEIPSFNSPFRKYLEAPDESSPKVRRYFAIIEYERSATYSKDAGKLVIMPVALGYMTAKQAGKIRETDIRSALKDMGLKGKLVRVLGLAALQPQSKRKGRRVFPKKTKRRKKRER